MRTHVEIIEELPCCRIWDVETGKEKAKLEGHTNWVQSVAISTDGKTIVSGSVDKTIRWVTQRPTFSSPPSSHSYHTST